MDAAAVEDVEDAEAAEDAGVVEAKVINQEAAKVVAVQALR